MKRSTKRVSFLARLTVPLLAATASIGFVLPAAANASVHPAKALTTVTIGGSPSGDFGQIWIGQQAGYFKKNGLAFTFVSISGLSTAAETAAFLANDFQFLNNAAASTMIARQAGAPIEAIVQTNLGQQQDITISAAAAAQFHIPAAGNTPAQAVAQILALKGTHITLAASGGTAISYINLLSILHKYNMTAAVGCATCDVNVQFAGTTTAEVAAFNANKFQAFVNNPPNSIQGTGSVYVNMGVIPPVSQATGLYLETTDNLVETQPALVQGVVNSVVEGWAYAHLHPKAGERMYAQLEAQYNQITSPDEDQFLWNDVFKYWKTPWMVRSAFQTAEAIVNVSQTPKITLSYNQWCQNKFVEHAAKTLNLGIKVPTTA